MMDVNGLISEASQLFNEGKYAEVIEKLEQANKITHEITQTEERINIQSGLGRCHLELAMKSKNKYEADKLFGNAVKHYQECLRLAKIYGKNSVQQQIDAQFWLGRCYFEHAKKTKDTDKAGKLFELAVEHYQEWLQLAKQLKDKQSSVQLAKQLTDEQGSVQQQINAQSWLGHCYFEHAKKTKDTDKAGKLFEQAATSFEQQLQLSEQLENDIWQKKEPIWKLNTRYLLGRCFFEQARISKDKTESFIKSVNFFNELREEILNINKEEKKKKNLPFLYSNEKEKEGLELEKKIHHYLRDIDYLNEDWISYFEKKKQEIQESLFKSKTSQPQDAVSTILAVLYITPMELGSIPMAHYTSPHVCHILFGIGGKETASPMRLGSSTYMNDPSEGRGLLDLLNQQDLELENKADGASHNAFFTCFSSRVNDLNQFRLYGKEDGVEASGCCLVFNKNGDWLKESDVSAPFRSLSEMFGQNSDDLPEAVFSDNEYEKLPLYQVAYIAYKDEYIAEKKCGIWLSAPNKAFNLHQNLAKENLGSSIRFTLDANISRFGIRLKPVGNEEWHQFRLEKLKEALEELIRFFGDKSAVSDDDKEALEYIRYLFKDFAFRDEEEFRLLVIKPIDPKEIEYCEKTQSVYVPYADIWNLADEVILGTNYEKTGNQHKAEVFRYQMKQKCPDVKVSRSTLPINPPNK